MINTLKFMDKEVKMNVKDYWDKRYSEGGNSGKGSYKEFAEFKVNTLNKFIAENKISSVVDFGCGDGNIAKDIICENYIGFDISKEAVKLCKEKIKKPNKRFDIYEPKSEVYNLLGVDLSISLDVVFHLVEDELFEKYLNDLFSSSNRFVVIFAPDVELKQVEHCRYRKFTGWIEDNILGWKLINVIDANFPKLPFAFYVYKNEKSS